MELIDSIIASSLLLMMAIISNIAYRKSHQNKNYIGHKTKRIDSPKHFSLIYVYIKYTTLVIGVLCYFFNSIYLLKLHQNLVLTYIGLALASIGIVMFVSAKFTLGEHYSPCYDSYVPKDIIRDGLFRYIRHPIYSANVLFLAGISLSTSSVWIILNTIMLVVYYYKSAIKEEDELSRTFGEYKIYKKSTGRFLPIIFRTK